MRVAAAKRAVKSSTLVAARSNIGLSLRVHEHATTLLALRQYGRSKSVLRAFAFDCVMRANAEGRKQWNSVSLREMFANLLWPFQ